MIDPAVHLLRQRLLRGAVFLAVLCTTIALLLTVLFGGSLVVNLVYAFSIGLCCWLFVDVARIVISWGLHRRSVRQGHPVSAPPGPDLGWWGLVPLLLAGALLGPPLGLTIGDALTGRTSPSFWDLGSQGTRITLTVTLVATLLTMVVRSAQERSAALALRAEAAQREAAETQLRLLQSQLEPHMLFNTLANLRVLIGLDPPRAQAMLDRLIAFLRSTLAASRRPWQPLADEFARVEDYLALMAVRMGPRLRTRLAMPPDLAAVPVPPLLLQPLVENAIQHGLEPQVDGGRIEVAAVRDGARLRLTVRDTGVGLAAPATPGTRFGLAQVRERLHTLYGDHAALQLEPAPDADGGTLVTLTLPIAP